MNRTIGLFLSLAVLLAGCDGPPPAQKSQQQAATPVRTEAVEQKPVQPPEPPAAKVWPFIQEGEPVPLAKNPTARNIVLVYDGSGSMAEQTCGTVGAMRPKIEIARAAVSEWVKSVPPETNMGLVAFSEGKVKAVSLRDASGRMRLIADVQAIRPGGKTPLGQAVRTAYAMLTSQGQSQLGYGEYVIVVVTDGQANDEAQENHLAPWVDRILRESPVGIFTIGLCIDQKHSLNQPGRTIYRAAGDPQALRKGLSEVAAESEAFKDSSSFGAAQEPGR